MAYFHDVYGVDYSLTEVVVPSDSALVGHRLDDVEGAYRVRIIASKLAGADANFGPGTIARDTEVTDAGLEHLQSLTSLQRLDLRNTQVTDEGVKKLQAALPNCEIAR